MAEIEILKQTLPLADANIATTTPTPKLGRRPNIFPALVNNDKHEGGTGAFSFRGKPLPKAPDEFFKDLFQFHEKRGTPIVNMPRISGRVIDLHKLYSEVTERGGFLKVNIRDDWDEIVPAVGVRDKCLNATAAIKQIYRRFLEKYERLTYFGEDPDKIEALEAIDPMESGRRARYPSLLSSSNNSTALNAVPMSYNYRQHIVNNERRRINKMSTDLYKTSPFEKLMLSLLSPLPNEQDFAINVCTLMSNESKHTLKLNEHPKLLDILLAHTGIFADYTLRTLFEHVYAQVRESSLFTFWRDLLYDKSQIFELFTDEQAIREALLLDPLSDKEAIKGRASEKLAQCYEDDFFNLKRGEGTQDYAGQRVQQISAIFRNLSFFDENLSVLAKNKTFLRYIVMAANVRWGNIHIQALDIAGNVATELELLDPSIDNLSRSLMTTLCEGIEGVDRAVILNCLEILYKMCQNDSNEEYINKCLNLKFYETICQFLSLNDIMLLIYTLEAIYALTSSGTRACSLIMQVRGVIDQLVALITVEAQSYGPDGCILMRVVETVPGNMLPMVAQNIANLQNVAVKQQQQQQLQHHHQQQQQQQIQPQLNAALQANATATIATAASATVTQSSTEIPVQQIAENENKIQIQQPTQQQSLQQQPTPQQQQSTATVTPNQMPQNYTQEDEQYALAWLGATFERSIEGRVEQQELYRMYLAHCQKSGKHSVVNHQQFPRLVRLIYNQNVGPIPVRGADGVDIPGYHYVGIKVRAQPLNIAQGKISTQKMETPIARGRGKKMKIKQPQPIPQLEKSNDTNSSSSESKIETTTITAANQNVAETNTEVSIDEQTPMEITNEETQRDTSQVSVIIDANQQQQQQLQQPSTSLIKSLLANKVTQRQQKQKELVSHHTNVINQQQPTTTTQPQQQQTIVTSVITPTTIDTSTQPLKVASTAISALVNNPLMQHTPVKVGQTTIKPLSLSSQHIEKKPILDSTPPPLAPLSGNNVVKDSSGRSIIIATSSVPPRLVEIGDKKPHHHHLEHTTTQIAGTSAIIKRKLDNDTPPPPLATKRCLALDETPVTPSKSAANLYAEIAASILEDEDMEDMIPTMHVQQPQPPPQQQQSQILRIQQQPQQKQTVVSISNPMQRQQLIFHQTSTNLSATPSLPQLKATTLNTHHHQQPPQQIPTAMATIKTDQGLQTVPVILQQKPMDAQQLHHLPQQTTTQYVLATNPQGQTYLVAQQTAATAPTPPPPPPPPPAPTQTVLVTQTPQQQSAGTKTIIILQQQPTGHSHAHAPTQQIITTGGGQKMIMTTPQGQQVLVTQRPATPVAPTQQQIFINPQTGAATHIQHVPAAAATVTTSNAQPSYQRQIVQNNIQQQQQPRAGQISPTLLSQLNQIPATIKLHQPQPPPTHTTPQQTQPATISRIGGKPVSIVQTQPIQIPPLQQHQSIIQQHIVSGPAEKRQVILSGGRTIEIKETIITQTPQQTCQQQQQQQQHQSQLNSQTIITTQQQHQQQQTPPLPPSTPPSTVIQQHHHHQQQTQLGQQKFCAQVVQHQQQHQPATTMSSSLITQKIADPPSLIATSNIAKQQQTLLQPTVPGQQTHTIISNIKKAPMVQMVTTAAAGQTLHQQQPQTLNQHQVKINNQVSIATPILTPTKSLFTATGPPPLAAVSGNASLITGSGGSSGSANTLPTQQPPESKQQVETTKSNIVANVPTSTTITQTSVAAIQNQQHQSTIITSITGQPLPAAVPSPPIMPHPSLPTVVIPPIDPNWLYVCDWRNCPRRKYKSLNELQYHVTVVHCPDHLDAGAEIFCQWGATAGLCDGVPRKRFSLMTHLVDRHLNTEALKAACQRRINAGTVNVQPSQPPVTIMRNPDKIQQQQNASNATGGGATSSLPSNSNSTTTTTSNPANTMGYSALHAIKRHTADFINAKELLDENEGPVTKSIRLTAALILRNLVTYTDTAKRSLRRYEPHLANIALSNVESSGALSHILGELSDD